MVEILSLIQSQSMRLSRCVATVLVWLACFIAPFSVAAEWADIANSRDVGNFVRFPDTVIVRYSEQPAARYLLALGKVKKIDGSWQPESSREISGQWNSVTYRAPDRETSSRVFAHFKTQFDQLGYESLFECEGPACGSSSKWANDVFQEKVLYGPKIHQRYFAGKLGNKVVTLYAIKRGNKRTYARIDFIDTDAPETESGAASAALTTPLQTAEAASEAGEYSGSQALIENGRLVVALEGDNLPASMTALLMSVSDWMQTDAGSRATLRVVGHRYGADSVAQLQAASAEDANAVIELFRQSGVPTDRLQAYGVGPLAPGSKQGADRVVLTLQ